MLIKTSAITKQEVRQTAWMQLQQCKEQLRRLEAYTAKRIQAPQQLWVSKKTIETYEQCQALYRSMDQLTSLVNSILLSRAAALIQQERDNIYSRIISP